MNTDTKRPLPTNGRLSDARLAEILTARWSNGEHAFGTEIEACLLELQRLRLAPEPDAYQAEIATVTVKDGFPVACRLKAPGLPDGDHDLFCVPHPGEPVAEPVCESKVTLTLEHGQPYGIRDATGYLLTFSKVQKYAGQDDRYREELEGRFRLADFITAALVKRSAPTKIPEQPAPAYPYQAPSEVTSGTASFPPNGSEGGKC